MGCRYDCAPCESAALRRQILLNPTTRRRYQSSERSFDCTVVGNPPGFDGGAAIELPGTQEKFMSNLRLLGQTIIAAVTAVAVQMTAPAYAFNPQPDPPAKILKGIDWGDRSVNTGAFGRVRNGLVEDPNMRNALGKGGFGHLRNGLIDDPNLRTKSK
jgi:hypothetical protein